MSTFAFVIETDPTAEHMQYLEDRLYEFKRSSDGHHGWPGPGNLCEGCAGSDHRRHLWAYLGRVL
jgi:hypothetical protein